MRDASYCRAMLKSARSRRKEANDLVRYWGDELRAARAREADTKAAREAGVDPPAPVPAVTGVCECPGNFIMHGTCVACGHPPAPHKEQASDAR